MPTTREDITSAGRKRAETCDRASTKNAKEPTIYAIANDIKL